jgi:hypothetical protein
MIEDEKRKERVAACFAVIVNLFVFCSSFS